MIKNLNNRDVLMMTIIVTARECLAYKYGCKIRKYISLQKSNQYFDHVYEYHKGN